MVHRAAADDAHAPAGEAERGQGRASATYAPSDPRTGRVAAQRGRWARSVLRRADEQCCAAHVPLPGWPTLDAYAAATWPAASADLGADAGAHRSLVAARTALPSLPVEATWRHHLR